MCLPETNKSVNLSECHIYHTPTARTTLKSLQTLMPRELSASSALGKNQKLDGSVTHLSSELGATLHKKDDLHQGLLKTLLDGSQPVEVLLVISTNTLRAQPQMVFKCLCVHSIPIPLGC